LSNDPAGDLNPEITYEVNHRASVRLAELAKEAGVGRFLFSSSCSIYGAQDDTPLDESAEFLPVTPYGESKLFVERDLENLADDNFSPTYLRNATAYGVSERLRGDLVVNNLTGFAVTTGKVFLKSDGSSWRPLVHIEDISRAFCAMLDADRSKIHNEAFNIGATAENYLIRDVAEIVADVVGCPVTLSDEAFNDIRNYKVNCDKYENLTIEQLEGGRFMRLHHLRQGIESGAIATDLRKLVA